MSEKQSIIFMDNFEMLKALYDFTAVYPRTMSFDEGEYFILHQTSARQRNWWQVVNMKGNIGFVPSNYVTKMQVEPEFLVGFLDSSIESLKLSKEDEINGIIMRTELIQRLEDRKKQIESSALANISREHTPERRRIIHNGNEVATAATSAAAVAATTTTASRPSENGTLPRYGRDLNATALPHKHDLGKKSLSSPSVSSAAAQMPALIQESPSMSVLTTKLDEIIAGPVQVATAAVVATATAVVVANDVSVTSEPSEATTTTTSDEITTISKVDEPKVAVHHSSVNSNAYEPCTDEVSTISDTIAVSVTQAPNSSGSPLNGHDNGLTLIIEAQDVYHIVDSIRQNTSLSHPMACVALKVVLAELNEVLPNFGPHLSAIAAHLADDDDNILSAPDSLLGETHDAQRLRILFTELADCKNDAEQRSWMLYEDEQDIMRYLTELNAILVNADAKICRYEMAGDNYQAIINLVLYYQMETRWSIRTILFETFRAMCHLDATAVDLLVGSVFPVELAEDIKSNVRNVERLKAIADMMTLMFSLGIKMPVTHDENLGIEFVLFVMDLVEHPPPDDVADQISDAMLHLLLSFNLQFDEFTNSVVLQALQQLKSAKTFTEKILLLVNREDDPVRCLKHATSLVNSVLKMLVDLFSSSETASLFYTNDNKVLIDILVRQLSDLSPGDFQRRWYLQLCRRILRNTNYTEHTHRKQDLMKIFTRIFCEETECSVKDQQLVREIANEFPQIFKA